jgi:SPP1 family predicted phage head-tail adaptor
MRTGKLNQRITFWANNAVSDNYGGEIDNWTEVQTTWANIKGLTGRRELEFQQVVNGKPYEIVVRWRNDISITETNKIVWEGRTLYLHSVIDEDSQNWFYKILAFEKV